MLNASVSFVHCLLSVYNKAVKLFLLLLRKLLPQSGLVPQSIHRPFEHRGTSGGPLQSFCGSAAARILQPSPLRLQRDCVDDDDGA